MNKILRHCKALKFKDEPPGMCCSNGKSLISGKTLQSKQI